MKILIAHNHYQLSGGEDNVVHSEKNLLLSRNHNVCSFESQNSSIKGFYQKLKVALNTHYSKRSAIRFRNVLIQESPEIVHIHNLFPIITPSILDVCKEFNIPTILTLHNYRLICPNALLYRKSNICELCVTNSTFYAIIHKCYKESLLGSLITSHMVDHHRRIKTWHNKVDRFIVLTEFAKGLLGKGGIPKEKMSIKPNFISKPPSNYTRNKTQRKGALFVGRLSVEKGVKTLLKAWEKTNIQLSVAGEGPLSAITNNFKNNNINSIGYISPSSVSDLMQCCSFLIFPSECYEGFPMVIVEAFANGLPVIASRLGGMVELVENGKTGFHFTPGDSDDLSVKVRWMHEHPDECRKMGQNARQVYEQKYTPEKNYRMLMSIYQSAIYEKKSSIKSRS